MAGVSNEFDYLRDKHRQQREQNSPELNLRTHRSISWIARAAALIDDDPDAAFIFSWIAFNAAYAKDMGDDPGSFARTDFQNFFDSLVRCDPKGRIAHEIWYQFEGVVTELLDNKYIFSPFWKFHNGDAQYDNWELRFENAKKAAQYAIEGQETAKLLSILFDRLYVLRNQLVHGGATWNSQVNRKQVRDGAALLLSLLPVFVDTMISNPNEDWGAPYYPVVD
ncbi:MAG: HEPN domain-containing protein [Rhodobacteraceae bacterium]|nr:HEPN domain-containing protein [Paracoccaceae bacterium]